MNAAVYTRVSTDNQETEGTSLQTQLEACRNYCQDKGYEVAYLFSEAYSGLTLERPKLNELRELVRNEQIDLVVVYCLDRFSRDPTHGVILTQELEKHSVKLEAVTEDVDNSELGKLISYIRGFASKLEAEKIRERTTRGKKARAREGRIPGGGFAKLYGYAYIKVAYKNGGRRVIKKNEARWVRQIYHWLVNEGLSTNAIVYRLRALNAPTKNGNMWCKQTVRAVLKNPAYTGKTYAFTNLERGKPFSKPQSEWIEIPGEVTPKLIEEALFEAAQRQLQINQQKTVTTTKYEYLLRGHIRCRQCGRAYVGGVTARTHNGNVTQRYRCTGKWTMHSPIHHCQNKDWTANKLEPLVWAQIERVLGNPELIITEIEKQRQDADQLGVFEAELQQVERQFKAVDREQRQLLQWALKDFPADQVEAENKRLNKARETLKAQKIELEAQIKASQEAAVSIPKLERFVELMREKLATLDFETRRMAIEMLDIKVWLDGQNIEVTGVLPVDDDVTLTIQPMQVSPTYLNKPVILC